MVRSTKKVKREEKYEGISMFEVVKMCEEYMTTAWKYKHKKGSDVARYPKIIADFKSDLIVIEKKGSPRPRVV